MKELEFFEVFEISKLKWQQVHFSLHSADSQHCIPKKGPTFSVSAGTRHSCCNTTT
jgi:hypothetical protein